jgi:hypothetical protein
MVARFSGLLFFALFYGGMVAIPAVAFAVFFIAAPSVYGLFLVMLFVNFTALVVYFVFANVRHLHRFHIAAYYSRRIGDEGINTWLNGEEIGKKMREIDQICIQKGVSKLTEFGFYDDYEGDQMIWHDAGAGLVTLKAISNHLRAAVAVDETLLIEISRLEYALNKATEKEIQFSLLLWPVNSGTNAMEWEKRQGTCW